MLGPRRGL